MFTGLVEGTGTLLRTDHSGADARMVIKADFPMGRIVLGESISVDGVCLTVTTFQGDVFSVDASAETLYRTTLGKKQPGKLVNLERALRLGDRLGGHLVSGHVDAVGRLGERVREGKSWRLSFHVPREFDRYIVEKGSIAINGISLTVNGCGEGLFHVNIIPHTAGATTIHELRTGDEVNIETDLMGKYVEKMLLAWKPGGEPGDRKESPQKVGIDLEFLARHGFS